MAKDKPSRDQKRKAKLAKRARKTPEKVTPYEGTTYQSPKWSPYVFETELAIHEADAASGRTLTNAHVRKALTELVLRLRAGLAPTLPAQSELRFTPGAETELLITNIRLHWGYAFDKHGPVATPDLVGILRTLLFSIEAQAWHRGAAAGYLSFLRDWMKGMGVRITRIHPDQLESESSEGSPLP